MTSKHKQGNEPGEGGYVNKMFRLSAEAVQAFEILKAKQGPRSGPRLAGEAIDLLLQHYGEKPAGPLRPGAVGKRAGGNKPKAGS
jgi:hypothetical protein